MPRRRSGQGAARIRARDNHLTAPRMTQPGHTKRELQMLDTARILFGERGFAAVTMDDLAAEIGVAKPLLFSTSVSYTHLTLPTTPYV